MKLSSIFDVAIAIVTVALVMVIVTNPTSAQVIGAIGESFATALKAATGKGQ